jgi:hypothetical protein
MTKRLQVLLDDEELAAVRRAARKRRVSVAEWVRGALRQARAADAGPSAADKLRLLHASTAYEFPTGPIEQVLDEIAQGYGSEP